MWRTRAGLVLLIVALLLLLSHGLLVLALLLLNALVVLHLGLLSLRRIILSASALVGRDAATPASAEALTWQPGFGELAK